MNPLHTATALAGTLCFGCGGAAGVPRCPEGMVGVPGGRLRVGLEAPRQEWDPRARDLEVAPFCIDLYEYPNRPGELPRNEVSWNEARELCLAQGKRLCHSAEWERACRGPAGWAYSYGPERDPQACNTPLERSPGPGSEPGLPLAPSGSHPRCRSREGAYDLNGSLSEWVEDPWEGRLQPFEPPLQPGDIARIQRGGTMWADAFYGQDCFSIHGHGPRTETSDDGFRCCRDPD